MKYSNITLNNKELLFIGGIILLNVFAMVMLVNKYQDLSFAFFLGYAAIIFGVLVVVQNHINFSVLLLMLSMLPMLYINNNIHYSFKWIVIQNFPLYILLAFVVLNYFHGDISKGLKVGYLELPVILILLYSIVSAAVGYLNGHSIPHIRDELYQFLYFGMVLIVPLFIKNRNTFLQIINFIIGVFIIIALEHIVFYFLYGGRYVSFQSNFFLVAIGIIFSLILVGKKSLMKKLFLFTGLIIVILGLFFTLTRGLWVSGLIALGAAFIFYLIFEKGFRFRIFLPFIFLAILSVYLMGDKVRSDQEQSASNYYQVSYRSSSIINPTEDTSFLMRVEAGYYAVNKFMTSPVFGKGFGDYYKYVIIDFLKAPHYYLDNSWLYFLWKGGVIGILLMLLLYYRFFKVIILIIRKTSNKQVKVIFIGILAGFVAMMFLSVLTAVLIKYKLNLLIAIFIAYASYEYDLIIKQDTENRILET